MGRKYVVKLDKASSTGPITLIQLKSGASSVCMINKVEWGQTASTTSAMVNVQLIRKSGAATVTSFTPLLSDPGDNAAKAVGSTTGTGISASAEGTDTDVLENWTFNVLSSMMYLPPLDERHVVGGGGIIAVKLITAVAYTVTCNLEFEEFGG